MHPFSLQAWLMTFVLTMLLMDSSPAAASAFLDKSFSDDGVRIMDGAGDQPIAACPTANGRLLLVSRDGYTNLSVTRLLENGGTDTSFGIGGMRGVDLPKGLASGPIPALCRPDGSVWMLSQVSDGLGDANVSLFSVAANGSLIQNFAGSTNGMAEIDLDESFPGLSDLELPKAIASTADGGALIVGDAGTTGSGRQPFVIKVSALGLVERVAFPMPASVSNPNVTAVATGPNGAIWVVGDGTINGHRAFRMYLDPASYLVARTEIGSDDNVYTNGGVLLRPGVMVVGAIRTPALNGVGRPNLLVFRDNAAFTMSVLPTPLPKFGPNVDIKIKNEGATVTRISNDSVFFAGQIDVSFIGGSGGRPGWYFTRVLIGDTAAEDKIDLAFGDQGREGLSLASAPYCSLEESMSKYVAVHMWKDRPLMLGQLFNVCSAPYAGRPALVRLNSNSLLFKNGLEGR